MNTCGKSAEILVTTNDSYQNDKPVNGLRDIHNGAVRRCTKQVEYEDLFDRLCIVEKLIRLQQRTIEVLVQSTLAAVQLKYLWSSENDA